jgi:plastocyanin
MKKAFVVLAVLIASLAFIACGSDDDDDTAAETTPAESTDTGGGGDGGGGGGEALTLTADPDGNLSWEPTELTAAAGPVTIELDNPSPVAHDVEIEGNGVEEKSDLVTDGTASVTADLKAGEYKYYCTVPGHEDAGMTGTLTVE